MAGVNRLMGEKLGYHLSDDKPFLETWNIDGTIQADEVFIPLVHLRLINGEGVDAVSKGAWPTVLQPVVCGLGVCGLGVLDTSCCTLVALPSA